MLSQLLRATEPESEERAWAAFVQEYSRLIFAAAREGASGQDDTMDRYAFILEKLRDNSCGRLRVFDVAGPAKFTTWLVVVATRLSTDYQRSKYGRVRAGESSAPEVMTRRRLVDFIGEELDAESISAPSPGPDAVVRERELRSALETSLRELDDEERLLLTLRFEDERPVTEIMVSLGLPSKFHVYRRINAALRKLRGALEERGVEEPAP